MAPGSGETNGESDETVTPPAQAGITPRGFLLVHPAPRQLPKSFLQEFILGGRGITGRFLLLCSSTIHVPEVGLLEPLVTAGEESVSTCPS